jgi:hypothetical protein
LEKSRGEAKELAKKDSEVIASDIRCFQNFDTAMMKRWGNRTPRCAFFNGTGSRSLLASWIKDFGFFPPRWMMRPHGVLPD